jgi:hypothetical protein
LLIAALASLSTVDAFELEPDELPLDREPAEPRDPPDFDFEELLREEEVLRVDLAIFLSPSVGEKTL